MLGLSGASGEATETQCRLFLDVMRTSLFTTAVLPYQCVCCHLLHCFGEQWRSASPKYHKVHIYFLTSYMTLLCFNFWFIKQRPEPTIHGTMSTSVALTIKYDFSLSCEGSDALQLIHVKNNIFNLFLAFGWNVRSVFWQTGSKAPTCRPSLLPSSVLIDAFGHRSYPIWGERNHILWSVSKSEWVVVLITKIKDIGVENLSLYIAFRTVRELTSFRRGKDLGLLTWNNLSSMSSHPNIFHQKCLSYSKYVVLGFLLLYIWFLFSLWRRWFECVFSDIERFIFISRVRCHISVYVQTHAISNGCLLFLLIKIYFCVK